MAYDNTLPQTGTDTPDQWLNELASGVESSPTFLCKLSTVFPQWLPDAWPPQSDLSGSILPTDSLDANSLPMSGYVVAQEGRLNAIGGDTTGYPFFGYIIKDQQLWPIFVSPHPHHQFLRTLSIFAGL